MLGNNSGHDDDSNDGYGTHNADDNTLVNCAILMPQNITTHCIVIPAQSYRLGSAALCSQLWRLLTEK